MRNGSLKVSGTSGRDGAPLRRRRGPLEFALSRTGCSPERSRASTERARKRATFRWFACRARSSSISACRRATPGGRCPPSCRSGVLSGERLRTSTFSRTPSPAALAHLNATQDVPISFGVLTCDNEKQAMARSGGAAGHAGLEAAVAAIAMARLSRGAQPGRPPLAGSAR